MRSRLIGPPLQLYALLLIAAIAAIAPFARVLGELYNIWNLKPEYSHGVIIPVLSAFLIWRQRAELRTLPFRGSWSGLILIAAGLLLRFVGERTTMHTFEHYAFLLVLYGMILALTGTAIFRRLWMPLLILIFAVPLPSFFNNSLSLHLQLLSSQLGVWVIRATGISVLLEGNVIDLGNYQLEVAEACSGLRYLFPLMTLAFIVAYLFRGSLWKRVLLFASSVPITVVMNSLRIGFIGITVEHWGPGMAEGALHDFEGWIVFMLSTGALLLTALLLARLGPRKLGLREALDFHATAPVSSVPAARQPHDAAANRPTRAIPRSFLGAAILLCVGAVVSALIPVPQITWPPRMSFGEFPTQVGAWRSKRDTLDGIYLDALRLDDYVLADFNDEDGSPVNFYSAYYQSQDATRAIHSPQDCIPGGGWEIKRLERRTFGQGTSAEGFQYNRAIIQLGAHRQIVYYWFQERGRRITNEYVARWYLFWDALTRHRTDGALVRFVAPYPVGANEADVDARILKLAGHILPTLNRYVPD